MQPDEGSWVTSSTSTAILSVRTVRTLQRVVIPRWAECRLADAHSDHGAERPVETGGRLSSLRSTSIIISDISREIE